MIYKLGEIAEISSGQNAPQGTQNYCKNGIPFVKAGNLYDLISGKDIGSIQQVNGEVAKQHNLKLQKKGTILFAKSGMSCLKGYVYELPREAYVVSHLACVTPKKVAPEYLRYYFAFNRPNQLIKDEAYPSISLSDIAHMDIPIPDDEIIKETISVLRTTERVIKLYRQQLAKLDELVKARFVEMFGDLKVNSKGWTFSPLSKVCDIRDGTHDSPKYVKNGYPLMTSKNFANGKVDFTGANLISENDFMAINKRSKVDVGDIVMPMIGTIGHPVIINTEKQFAIKNVALIKFTNSNISNIFVKAILDSDYFLNIVKSKNRGNTQKFIALNDIRNICVPNVPIVLQNEFSAFVTQVDQTKSVMQKVLDKAQLLFDSLMQKYFG